MPEFKDLKSLFKHIEKNVAESMKDEVAETVKEVEQEAIENVVYDAYSGEHPWVYERRKDDGGLSDKENMHEVVTVVNGNVILSITNMTTGSQEPDLYIAPLVEFGDNAGYGEYQYKFNRDNTAYQYLQPRPFTEATIENLRESGVHVIALKDSLKRKGFKIE